MKAFFALLRIVTLLVFVFTEAYAVDEIQTEPDCGIPYYARDEKKPVKVDNKPVAILPEDPVTLELGDENGEDNKGKGGRKTPGNTPTQKPDYHRKMMYR